MNRWAGTSTVFILQLLFQKNKINSYFRFAKLNYGKLFRNK